ncbi:MAG: hypothetical protein JWN73_4411 [Betaproteobacteria bacterium]|nr:hypothetical protein [Betaproteobacteria bacterium]
MALCPSCGSKVLREAPECPHCHALFDRAGGWFPLAENEKEEARQAKHGPLWWSAYAGFAREDNWQIIGGPDGTQMKYAVSAKHVFIPAFAILAGSVVQAGLAYQAGKRDHALIIIGVALLFIAAGFLAMLGRRTVTLFASGEVLDRKRRRETRREVGQPVSIMVEPFDKHDEYLPPGADVQVRLVARGPLGFYVIERDSTARLLPLRDELRRCMRLVEEQHPSGEASAVSS